jgi:transposase InsO family protein
MTWVQFLKSKSETFERFKVFRRLVENEAKENIGALQTNNGGEFTSNEFQNLCSENGIIRKLKNVYTPQHKGVTERMNHTLLGMARSMLTLKNLSPSYWAKKVHTTVYLRRRSTTVYLDGITPYEAWYEFKPQI